MSDAEAPSRKELVSRSINILKSALIDSCSRDYVIPDDYNGNLWLRRLIANIKANLEEIEEVRSIILQSFSTEMEVEHDLSNSERRHVLNEVEHSVRVKMKELLQAGIKEAVAKDIEDINANRLHISITSLVNVLVSIENNRDELLDRDGSSIGEEGEITEDEDGTELGDGMQVGNDTEEEVSELAKKVEQMEAELAQKDVRIQHIIEDNPTMSLRDDDLEGLRIQVRVLKAMVVERDARIEQIISDNPGMIIRDGAHSA
ncbi:hypothetical protein VTL71DRAFT_11427 [Oculimacula yallundae]|uniref:Uncharacterized protein n=1 Tax=Oculimacula yallundae TaxID=86028 RepID=A0ABR4CQ59_9HELO